jgi:hypothetical protein
VFTVVLIDSRPTFARPQLPVPLISAPLGPRTVSEFGESLAELVYVAVTCQALIFPSRFSDQLQKKPVLLSSADGLHPHLRLGRGCMETRMTGDNRGGGREVKD